MDIRPNHTVYINNLNEKIKKEGMYVVSTIDKTPKTFRHFAANSANILAITVAISKYIHR